VPATSGPKPDLPGVPPLIDPGFNNYPANPRKSSSAPPGKGGDVTFLENAVYPPANPLDSNPVWKEINKQLNANLKINFIPPADYTTRLGTLMAGNDLPDMLVLPQGLGTVPNLPQFLESKAADLAPFLAGDRISDYPNLAFMPQYSWKNSGAVLNGHVYLLPIQQYRASAIMFVNGDVWDKEIGPNYAVKDAEDFRRILQLLTKPQAGQWGISATSGGRTPYQYMLNGLLQSFGAPNGWTLEGGKLIRDRETEAFKSAVGYVRDLVAAGVFHPNTPTYSIQSARNDFLGSKFMVFQDGFGGAWTDLWLRGTQQPIPVNVRYVPPFPASRSTKPVHHVNAGFLLANAFKRAPADRIQQLLQICNWFAAPFGSQEDLLLQYGLPDIDYKMDANGNPVQTSRGPADSIYMGTQFISRHPWTLYYPGLPDFAKVTQGAERVLLGMGIEDVTYGYYSQTFLTKGRPTEQAFADGVNEILAGHRPLTDYDQLVKDWQSNGGEQMRKEYLELMAAPS